MADEYIRRDDFIQHLEKCKKGAAVTNLVWAAIMAIERDVRDMPAADVAPVRHGHWIGEGDGYADGELVFDVWHCSECDYCIDDGTDDPERLPKYCPGCGALMDGGKENG